MESAAEIEKQLDDLFARCFEEGNGDRLLEQTKQYFSLIREKVLPHPDGGLHAHAFTELSSFLEHVREHPSWNADFLQFWWESVDALMLEIIELDEEPRDDVFLLHLFILGYWRDIICDDDDEQFVRLLSYLKHPKLGCVTVEVYAEAITMDWLPEAVFKRFRCFPVNLFREYERLRDRLDFTLTEEMYELIESYCPEGMAQENEADDR